MLFSSMTFVFMFLPIVCAIYLLVRPEIRNYILLAASMLFYAWGEPKYLAIMILTILVNYTGANYISRSRNLIHRKLLLVATILVDLSFLFYFKYFNFVLDNINHLFHTHIDFIDVIMPIGISFYTFQALSYVVDVYRGEVKAQRDIYKLALYITLFPQLVAGPIVKYHDVAEQISCRTVTFDKVAYGVKRFIIGLAKKMLIANTLGAVADKIFAQPVEQFDTLTAWIGAIAYTLQLYYDFSGYSDMAIGLGSIFGFKFLENFNYPYISKSITEFWRRWHISLSTWFKEYLYIPLGGNRVSKRRNLFNLFVVFLATGIWHGASWNYILWELYFFVFLVLERFVLKKVLERLPRAVGWIYAMLVVYFGWVLFKFENMAELGNVLAGMFGFGHMAGNLSTLYTLLNNIFLLIISIIAVFPIGKNLRMAAYRYENKRKKVPTLLYYLDAVTPVILILLSLLALVGDSYNPFLYFQF